MAAELSRTYHYGDLIGEETIEEEYKEFSLRKLAVPFSNKTIMDIIVNNKWAIISKYSNKVLLKYINDYIPKYFTSFLNSTEITSGNFWIGVSDLGEIIGIPLTMKKSTIEKHIINVIKKIIKLNEIEDYEETILENISIEMFDVKESETSLDCIDKYMKQFNQESNFYKMRMNSYIKKKKLINTQIDYYKRAINIIINEPHIRKELIDLVNSDTENLEIHKDKVLSELKSDEQILYKIGEVTALKLDPSNVAYWITKYRDIRVNEINVYRPERPLIIKPENPYSKLIHNINILAPRMLSHNTKMYILRITLPAKKIIDTQKNLFYIQNRTKTKKFTKRTVDIYKNPCCENF